MAGCWRRDWAVTEMVSTVDKEAAGRNNQQHWQDWKAGEWAEVEHTDPLNYVDASADQTVISDHGPSKPETIRPGIIKTLKLGKAAGIWHGQISTEPADPRVDDFGGQTIGNPKWSSNDLEEHIEGTRSKHYGKVMQDLHYDYPIVN